MKNSPEIQELRNAIEKSVSRRMKTPADFNFLADAVWEKLKENISSTTLKRLWGYINGAETIRGSTLNILSQFVGLSNWQAFLEDLNNNSPIQSDAFIVPKIESKNLTIGDLIEVSWQPNRHCVFEYLGNNRYVAAKAEHSKLKAGDTFECLFFLQGQPLYLDNLNGEKSYVAGKRDGLSRIAFQSNKQN